LTTDNDKEFAHHERIAEKLIADFFFAHPYASWERGANEKAPVPFIWTEFPR
jgi:IS30 family transposase